MPDPLVTELLDDVGLPRDGAVTIDGVDPVLATSLHLGEAAAAAVGAVASGVGTLWQDATGEHQTASVEVTDAAASLLSFLLLHLDGPDGDLDTRIFSPVTALYEGRDGRWIHLHGGLPHLASGTLALLGCPEDPDAIAAAVRGWDAFELEEALAAAGLCGAVARTAEEWRDEPQARATEPLGRVAITKLADGEPIGVTTGHRPLDALRVLDLTRMLAGPTVGRTLAEHGADVLLVTGPAVPNVPPFVLDCGHGKRAAHLDVGVDEERRRLVELAGQADVLVQGYRPGALRAHGLGPEDLVADHRGLVYVSVSCYGDVGPWGDRRGWEQMAESATGIVLAHGGPGAPALVPAAPCDYITGYLGALGAVAALRRRAQEGGSYLVQVSLCETGRWIASLGVDLDPAEASGLGDWRARRVTTDGPFGRLAHLPPVARFSRTPARWDLPPAPLGTHPAAWRG